VAYSLMLTFHRHSHMTTLAARKMYLV
jgi:hypothetical protein